MKKEYYIKNKEKILKHQKEYYQENRIQKLKYQKRYLVRNRGKINQYKKGYRIKNKEKISNSLKGWRRKNPKYHREYNQKYYKKNRKKILKRLQKPEINKRIRAYRKIYYQRTKEKQNIKKTEWAKKNPEKVKEYKRNSFKNNKNFATIVRLRNSFTKALKLYTKTGKIMLSKDYGIDYRTIIEHLKPFPKDLSDYQIHHIKPLYTFNFVKKDGSTNLEAVKEAFKPENHKWLTIEEHKEIHRILRNNAPNGSNE